MALRDRAKELRNTNPIMENRSKVKLDDIIARYPMGCTIRECAILHDTTNDSDYVVCVIEEDDNSFFFGGVALLGLVEGLLKSYDNEEDFYNDLKEEGLPVIFSKKRSKNGRVYTAVDVL